MKSGKQQGFEKINTRSGRRKILPLIDKPLLSSVMCVDSSPFCSCVSFAVLVPYSLVVVVLNVHSNNRRCVDCHLNVLESSVQINKVHYVPSSILAARVADIC